MGEDRSRIKMVIEKIGRGREEGEKKTEGNGGTGNAGG